MSTPLTLDRHDRLLVLAVHPDDETLGAGGLLQQAIAVGAAVRVVFVTDGDNNPWPQRWLEKRLRIRWDDRRRWGLRRRQEALAALAVLGVDARNASFMGLPDQGVTALLKARNESTLALFVQAIADFQPSLLLSPAHNDRHPDHSATARFADLALERLPAEQMRPRLLSYLVHGRPPAQVSCSLALTRQQLDNKHEAMLAHATQMALSRRRFLRYVREQELFYSPQAGHQQTYSSPAARIALHTLAIIPCYDAAEFCEEVILQTAGFADHVLVIDDGSTDGTGQILERLAAQMPHKISLISFPVNKGKGVGLIAGFREALARFDFHTLVTLDADGQHPPADIPALARQIAAGADMVIGERQVGLMPARSRLGNTLATAAIRWLYPHAPGDTQSGMRAFTREVVEEIVRNVPGSRYETEFQILLLALSRQRRIATVTIPTIYIDNNRSSKFRPIADTVRIAHALIRWRLSHAGAKAG